MEEIQRGINDLNYWNSRFQEDWESKGGREQSAFFSAIAFEYFPLWIKQYIIKEQPSFCDWGCALGDGTDYLRRALMLNNVTGIDFSHAAVEKAKIKYPEIDFLDCDLTNDPFDKKFNIIFSSNTIEHFYHPWETLKKISHYADQHLVVMFPFKEYEVCSEEHFSTFDFHSIPQLLNNDFILTHSEIIDTSKKENTSWLGLQILLVYSNKTFLLNQKISLDEIKIESTYFYNEQLKYKQVLTDYGNRNNELQSLAGQYSLLATALFEKDALVNNAQKQNEEISKQLFETEKKATEKERKIADVEMMFEAAKRQADSLKEENNLLKENLEDTISFLSAKIDEEKENNEKRISIHAEELRVYNGQISLQLSKITEQQNTLNRNSKELDEQEKRVQALTTQLIEFQAIYQKLLQELETNKEALDIERVQRANLMSELDKYSQMLETCKQESEELKNRLSDSSDQYNVLLKQIADERNHNKALQFAHETILQSRSWKFTKPLRFIHSLFK